MSSIESSETWVTPERPARDGLWFARRARNAAKRPILVVTVATVAFIATLIALLIIPRRGDNSARSIAALISQKEDTVALLAAQDRSRVALASAEAALASARQSTIRRTPPPPTDTLPPALIARRDSLRRAEHALDSMITRADNAPLPASYRALGELPELSGDPRVAALLDSLAAVEKEREEFGTVGGVDPIFVALTARATAIGRSIQSVAEGLRAGARDELVLLRPPPAPPPIVVALVDTLPIARRRNAAVETLDSSTKRLTEVRHLNAEIDRRVIRAREAANVDIPPLALLGAAIAIATILGFAAGLVVEMRRSRIADPGEAEEATGLRVLAVVLPRTPQPERSRRRADRETSPLLDATSDTYRLLYLHVAGAEPRISLLTVSGDETAIAATVAANLAAAATYDARSTLLVDAELSACAVSSVLRVRAEPGLGDVLIGRVDWTEVVIPATIGRERVLDVIPSGTCGEPDGPFDATPTRHALARMARRYDLVVLVAGPTHVRRGDGSILPAPDLIYCARIGHTTIAALRTGTEALRGAGARVRGLVLWDADVPLIESRDTAAARARTEDQVPLSTAYPGR
jgi:Mrp family chromosome partitioning ATPase